MKKENFEIKSKIFYFEVNKKEICNFLEERRLILLYGLIDHAHTLCNLKTSMYTKKSKYLELF